MLVFALIRTSLQNRRLSLLDPMTRLGNRPGLAGSSSGSPCSGGRIQALVVLDLKRFKQVNDLLGCQVGDRLIAGGRREAAASLSRLACRLGDEFAVVLATDHEGLEARMEAMVNLLQFEFVTRESSFDLACRFRGVARVEGARRPSSC